MLMTLINIDLENNEGKIKYEQDTFSTKAKGVA